MKNFKLKAILLLAVLFCSSVSTFADTTVWRGDINYYLYDDLTAEVYGANKDITTANIPEKITYLGKCYTVTRIGGKCFLWLQQAFLCGHPQLRYENRGKSFLPMQ